MNETSKITQYELLSSTLKSQYHASLAMLRQSVELYPQLEWSSTAYQTRVWQLAYHTLFFTHLYLQPKEADFRPWTKHQSKVQYPDGIPGPSDPNSSLPLGPKMYSKEEILEYLDFCDQMVDATVDKNNLSSMDSGFSWYKVSKLEHQLINIRHIQHGAAQIADRLRFIADKGVDWVGARRAKS
jgi:hypothetical protein